MTEAAGEEKIAKLAKFTCWPDHQTWLEFNLAGLDVGVLFLDEAKSVTKGYGMILMKPRDAVDDLDVSIMTISFNMGEYKIVESNIQRDFEKIMASENIPPKLKKSMCEMMAEGDEIDPIRRVISYNKILKELRPLIFGVLAFMNSPKIIRRVESDITRLNARRLKRGKYPYYPHHVVRLNIDKHALKVTPPTGHGAERGQYFVRSHLRFLVHPRYKKVEVTIVQPHYRGNPEIAMRNTKYQVDREHSKW